MLPDLLDGYEAPSGLDPAAVKAAAGRVRAACHWHIAPWHSPTWVMPVPTDGIVDLDTLRLVSIEQITVDGVTLVPDVDYDWSVSGRVELDSSIRGKGMRSMSITAVHGYESCPADLVALVAQLAAPGMGGQMVRSETTGPVTTSYFGPAQEIVLVPYRLPVVA